MLARFCGDRGEAICVAPSLCRPSKAKAGRNVFYCFTTFNNRRLTLESDEINVRTRVGTRRRYWYLVPVQKQSPPVRCPAKSAGKPQKKAGSQGNSYFLAWLPSHRPFGWALLPGEGRRRKFLSGRCGPRDSRWHSRPRAAAQHRMGGRRTRCRERPGSAAAAERRAGPSAAAGRRGGGGGRSRRLTACALRRRVGAVAEALRRRGVAAAARLLGVGPCAAERQRGFMKR